MTFPGVEIGVSTGLGSVEPASVRGSALRSPVRTIGGREFDFDRQVAVMAIVNRTPDSFSDHGRTFALDAAVDAALSAVAAGADWVDIGGVKFAPGAPVPAEVEAGRVLPVVRALHEASDVVISVDTFHASVARQAIEAGASVINDTTGLSDPELARVVADSDATLVITHSLARPRTAYPRPQYVDVVADVAGFLRSRVELAVALGVPEERIVVDPGHDLNKNTRHSLELSRRLGEICAIGLPTLVALSNKDFIGETLDRPVGERLAGSLAAAVACVLQGARIVRVHAVAPTVDAMRMVEGILGWREPMRLVHNMGESNAPVAPVASPAEARPLVVPPRPRVERLPQVERLPWVEALETDHGTLDRPDALDRPHALDGRTGNSAAEIRRLQVMPDAATDADLLAAYAVPDRSAPWVRANFVSSVDGAATHDGHSEGLGTAADKRVFQLLRWLADVIVVGAGTVRAEGYEGSLLRPTGRRWRAAHGLSEHPEVAIVSARLDLDPGSGVFTRAPVRPLVITTESAPADRRAALASVADIVECGASAVDPRLMLDALVARGLPQVHSEGGPHLLGSMIEAGVLDELCLTVSPQLEGGTVRRIVDGGAIVPTGMSLAHALAAADGTLLLRYLREPARPTHEA